MRVDGGSGVCVDNATPSRNLGSQNLTRTWFLEPRFLEPTTMEPLRRPSDIMPGTQGSQLRHLGVTPRKGHVPRRPVVGRLRTTPV